MGSQCCKCAKQNKNQKVTGFYTDSGKFRYREDQPIPSHRYNLQTRGKVVQLTLKQSQKDDTGHYALVAKKLPTNNYSSSENDNKKIVKQKIRMNVRESSDNPEEGEPPVFLRRLTDLSVKVGTRTRFLVEIRSSSSPKVTWHRNDLPVQSGARFSFVHEGNFHCVDVAPVMVEDQGHWTCMVENINGRSSCTSCLSVIVPKAYKPPEFVEQLRALLTETGTVSLECKVVGVPTPVLRWFKDEKEIKAGDVFALTANADDPTSLGTYACQAVNCMGTACSSSRVHVMGRGSREGSLKPADTLLPAGPVPVFKKILNDESCRIGENITLSCQVQVPPWPKAITWYNKEGRVESDEKYHVIEDGLGTYSIEVKGVEAMDEGEWKCVATSAENVMQFTTCFVAMSIPKNYRMPRFMESLKAVLTEEGLVSFECKVVGFPTPMLRWFKDGQELKPGDVYQLTGTNSLGSYCCIAKNCMGETKSTAELTVEDIQNQLNEEERLQLMCTNEAPKFIKGLRSCEARIHEDFTFTIQVSISPAPTLLWYRDDEPIVESDKYKMIREVLGTCHLEVHKLEFIDQAEWKCVAANDFGHSITSCFLKLIIPKHFKKPKFLESLRAILSEEGAVNLECKVIGVPQPILKWYKDGVELKPGDIHRITSGQDGTCCLGIYTCEATNCMGSVSSSASLLGFDDRVGLQNEEPKEPTSPLPHELARNLSLSTIHEERTSQLYDTPQTDHSITIDDRGEVSFSFDGKEVSVSLYETPDLTEEEAIQIVEMYADQLSEHITEGNVIELPPMRFMKETSTTGNLLMEAVVIDVSPDYFAGEDEADDLRTEADFEDVSIMDDQMQNILSSYSAPPGEQSGERTPMGSPPPRPPRRKERSGSASSKSEKSDRSQPKILDWSESYHSAKEPSIHAQLSVQSQDSVDAFADALSSEGLVKSLTRENAVKAVSGIEHMDIEDDVQYGHEDLPVTLLQSPEFTEEDFAAALKQSMDTGSPGKRKRKKKQSGGGTPMLSSKTSSEESYAMGVDGYEPEEKIQRRGSKGNKGSKGRLERRDSNSSNKSNKSMKNGKDKKKRKSRELDQSLKIEDIKLEKMIEVPQTTSQVGELYVEEGDGLLEERPESTASSVFTTAGEISDKSMPKSQKERLFESIKNLSNPVLVLRNTLVDLDEILMTYSEHKVDDETIQALILEKIVRPIENLCEQMSVIEMKAVNAAGDRSLLQDARISLLDTIGGPTEELLRGIELIRNHENETPEDFKSDLIVLESLTDPVDEILMGLARIEHELKYREGILGSIECVEHPIILERMTRSISRLGTNVTQIIQEIQSSNADPQILAIGERLECVYRNLDSFVVSLPVDKITGAIDSNVDTLVIETLVKPLEGLIRVLSNVSSAGIIDSDESTIGSLQKAATDMKTKLDTLTIALETYEMESGEFGVTEKNSELVNYLKWTMDDISDKLVKWKKSKAIHVPKLDDDVPGSIPVSSDEEWKLESLSHVVQPITNEEIQTKEQRVPIIKEKTPQLSENIDDVNGLKNKVVNLLKADESDELMESYTTVAQGSKDIITKESTPQPEREVQSIDATSKRAKYKSRLTSLDSATVELDETLPLPEMLLDPLIDVQAKLNSAMRHYESNNSTDTSSSPTTELSICLTELRESIAAAAHVATTLNISDTLDRMIDLREPLLDFQLALSSAPTPEETVLLGEVVRPLNELKDLVSATIRSPSVSESSQVILKQVVRMIDDIQDRLHDELKHKMTLKIPIEPEPKMESVKPPEEIEHASLALSGVHFALSTALAMADDSPTDEPGSSTTLSDPRSTLGHRLITSIEALRECVGDVAVTIASPIVPKGDTSEYNYEIVSDELAKLQDPLLNLQKILLTEEHRPEERHLLNNIASPLRALRETIVGINKSQPSEILELLEDVEKDVSLIAMEALKKSMEGKITREESSICDLTPGEVPRIISRWLDPIENWLTSASTEIDEKGKNTSAIAPVVDDLKRRLLRVAIQSSYSEPPSDIALIEQLSELKEPLSKVCEVIATQHDPADLEVMESLIQPTKHLLGTILDTSLTHRASSVLRPVLEALEELDNQIPLSIKTVTYQRMLQGVVRSLTPEEFESDENIMDLDKFQSVEIGEPAIAKEIIVEKNDELILSTETSPQMKIETQNTCSINLSDTVEHDEPTRVDEGNIHTPEFSQTVHDNMENKATTSGTESVEVIDVNESLTAPINVNFAAEEEPLKRERSQISSAAARAEELDLWSLTILGPLDRLASTTLSLDRSVEEDIHAHLCRPLDSLHKQIELVESQINRPAGQSLENDVETIIEGFLCPVSQVATALQIAVGMWQKHPLKDTVKQHLLELSDSCSDLCERLESLRKKLITEAPAQNLQVQKAEASLVETITAVLGPLEGIKEVIITIMGGDIIEDNEKTDRRMELTREVDESKNVDFDTEKNYGSEEVNNTQMEMETHDFASKAEVEHIEKVTARPLQELIEAIVDPNSVRHTSTTPEEMESIRASSNIKESESETSESVSSVTRDDADIVAKLDDQPLSYGRAQPTDDNIIMDEAAPIGEEIPHLIPENAIPHLTEEPQEYDIAELITTASLAKTTLHEIKHILETTSSQSVIYSVEGTINDLINEELQNHNVDPITNENLTTIIEGKLHTVILQHPIISQENILQATIRDMIQDMCGESASATSDSHPMRHDETDHEIIAEGTSTTGDLSKTEESKSEVDQEASSMKRDLLELEETNNQIIQREDIPADPTIYTNCIRDIARSELDRQSSLSFENESLMENIETSVREMMVKCPQICQENVFEESVRDIVVEELQKVKICHEKEVAIAASGVTTSSDLQIGSTTASEIISERIRVLVQNELQEHNIQASDDPKLFQTVEDRMQDMILSCPQIVHDDSLEASIHRIIAEEIHKSETGELITEGLIEAGEVSENKTDLPIEEITGLHIVEETIQNIILDELQEQHILTSESDDFTKVIIARIQEIIVTSPDKLPEDNIDESVRDIVREELHKARDALDVREIIASEECNFSIAVETNEPIATSSTTHVSQETIQNLVEEELQRQNMRPVDQSAIIESIQTKIQGIEIPSVQLLEQNTSDEMVRSAILEVIKTQISQIKSCEGSSRGTDVEISLANTSLDEQAPIINKKDLTRAHEGDDSVSVQSQQIDDTISQSSEVPSSRDLEENTDESRIEQLEEQNIVSVEPIAMRRVEKTLRSDIQNHESIAEMQPLRIAPISQETISEQHIQELVADEMMKHNAESSVDEEFSNAINAQIRQMIINNPDVCVNDSFDLAVREIIVENLEKEKAKVLEAENLIEAKELEVVPLTAAAESEVPTTGELHRIIIEELHKQNVEMTDEENIASIIESKVHDLTAIFPEMSTRHAVEKSVQEIHSRPLDDQKIGVPSAKKSVVHITKDPEEIVHELIIEELHKHNVLPSTETSLIEAVQGKLQKLMVHPEIYDLDSLKNNVQNMVAEVLKEEETKAFRVQELFDGDKTETQVEHLSRPSTSQGRISPEEMVHEFILEELHKQNLAVQEEGNIMKAIQADIQMLIMQHPEITEIDALEESIQEIVARALIQEKARLLKDEGLGTAGMEKISIHHIEASSVANIEAHPTQDIHSLIIGELHKQNVEPSQQNSITKTVEERIQDLVLEDSEILKSNTLEANIKEIIAETLEEQTVTAVQVDEHSAFNETKVDRANIELFATDEQQPPPAEVIHLLIVEELREQNAQHIDEYNLIKAAETKINDIILDQPELSNLDILQQRIHDVIAEILYHEEQTIVESTRDVTSEEKMTKFQDIKVSSSVQIEALTEEFIRPLIVEELHKQNLEPSENDNLLKAIETKVQTLIDVSSAISPEIISEQVHDIVSEVLEEQKAAVCDVEKLVQAEEKTAKVGDITFLHSMESEIDSGESVSSFILKELRTRNVQPAEEANLTKLVGTKMQDLIQSNPEECQAEWLSEKVHDMVAEIIKEQEICILNEEGLHEAEQRKKQVQEQVIEVPSPVHADLIQEEFIQSLIVDEVHKQNIQPSEEDSLVEAIKDEVKSLIVLYPETQQENLSEEVHNIVQKVLKEQRMQVVHYEAHHKPAVEKIQIENIATSSSVEIETISGELVHDLIIEELHKQNVKESEEANLAKAIETKLQNLIASCPKISKEDVLEEEVHAIVIETLAAQKAIAATTEELKCAEKRKVKIEEMQSVATSDAVRIPDDVQKIVNEEIDERNIELSLKQDIAEAVDAQVSELVWKNSQTLNAIISKENIRDIVSEVLLKMKRTSQEIESLKELPYKTVGIESEQFQSSMAHSHEHPPDPTSESHTEVETIVSDEVIKELINLELQKHNVQGTENFVEEVHEKIRNMIHQNSEFNDKEVIEEKIRKVTAATLIESGAKDNAREDIEKTIKQKRQSEDYKTSSTSHSDVPEEIVHELIIDELRKQNVQISEEANLVEAIQTKIRDFIQQHPKDSHEHIVEESVREIVTENLEKQKAAILEVKQLVRVSPEKNKLEVRNLPASNQIHIPEEIVHELIIDEFHKQNIEPLTEKDLVEAVEAKIHDLIANHPEMCEDDVIEESIHDIVSEVRAEHQANIRETESLAKANEQNVIVEVSRLPKKAPEAPSKELIENKVHQLSETTQLASSEDEKYERFPTAKDKETIKSEEHLRTFKKNELENEENRQMGTAAESYDINQTIEKQEQLTDRAMTNLSETPPVDAKREEKGDTKKDARGDIQLKAEVDRSEKKQKRHEEPGTREILSTKKPIITPAVNTDSEFESEFSECSKSTLRDIPHLEKQNQSTTPTIEFDPDITLAKEISSRQSMTSTRRFREQQASDFDNRSVGVYSSSTSRVRGSSHGPRDRGKKPKFCTRLTDRTAAEASRIKLTCTVLGDPEPEVYWTKDGQQLPSSSNRHCTIIENGLVSLELYAVIPKDSGEYSCVATNIHGHACTEAKLKVYAGYEPTPSLPTFTRSIKDTYRVDENALVLECRVRGQPSPTITWLKDGQVMEICDRYQQSDLADGICQLKIFHPDFYDSGLYTCRAENDTRLSDRTSHLVNFDPTGKHRSIPSWRGSNSCLDITSTHKDTGRPRFSSYLTDHNVPAGGTIALQVEVKGVPPPEITWMRTDKKGPISVPKARTFADSGVYTLIVPDATESETGTYVCRASNAYGHVDTSANVEVVSGSAHDGGKPAMFVSRPPDKHVIVAIGEDVSVSFRTSGVPKPRVFWMKGLRDITSGPRSYKEGHDDYVRLTLKRACLSDEGTYCILVKNCYGCDRSFFTIQVKQRARSLTPSPDWGPLDTENLLANIHDKERAYLKQVPGPISSEPVVVDGGRNWLALTWGKAEQRGPAPVIAYRVDAWLLGGEGGARWVELGITPINAYDAFNLRPGEEYKFRITPRNRYGWGEPVTMTKSVTVREIVKFPEFTKILSGQLKALAGTVLNLEAEVSSDSMAQIKWYRDTTEIENGQDSRFTTYFNGSKCSLMIGNISEDDSGRYVCEATNAAGRVSTFARVQVVEDIKIVEADMKLRKMRSSETTNEERPPEFTMRLRDRRVQATYPVRLTCQVTGYPEPEVTWYKYREEIYSHDNVAIWNDEAHFHTLEISRSTIDDSGIYMARAKNIYGSVTCRCHLVVDKGIRAYIAPEFLGHLDSVYTVKAGGELRMTAQVEAYPSVGITWHHDGHRLRPGRNIIMTLNHDGTVELELAHVTLRDAGLYCCTANNEVGQAESTTRVIVMETHDTNYSNQSLPEVIESTDVPYSKIPLFVTKPLSTEAFEGDTVIILCEVVGDPKPEVMWLRDFLRPDYYKDAPHFRRVGAGPQYRLEIPYAKFDFTGTYSIIAKNCHGEAKAVISLQIYARGQGKEDSGMESTIKHGNVQTLPVIKRPLRDLRCCDGDAITLVCKIHATPEPDVRWEKGGKLVPLGDDFATDFDGETARLSIQHVYPEDEGEYTCVAYNDLGKAYTSACLIVDVPEGKETALSRRLTKPQGFLSTNSTPISTPRSTPVRSLSPSSASKRELKPMTKISRGATSGRRARMPTGPKFYAVPHNRVAEEGETVRFQCAVAGHPMPWVTWDKDGISVTPTARISLKENDDVRILEITEITHEDAGLYRITLENDVGRTEATARLEILKGRHNSVSRSIRTRSASPRTYSIYGRSHLSPTPRPSARLQPPQLSETYSSRGGTISPTLPRWHQRNGKHSVQTDTKTMSNGNTTMKTSTRVVRSSSIPRQTASKKNIDDLNYPGSPMRCRKIVDTQSVQCPSRSEPPSTIPARVGTNPKSKLPKKRSSTSISPTKTSDKSRIPVHGDINNISASSTTTTTANEITSTRIVKGDQYLPMEPMSPIILAAPADVIALRGAKVTLLATYDGYPKPTVKWLRDGHDITLDDKIEIETGDGLTCLTLMNITTNESGKYEVRIENKVGSDSRYVNVTVEGPPEPPADKPTIHSVIPLGNVTLTWRTPVYDGGSAVTGYTVEMRRGDEPCWIAVAEARHSLTHTVQQLDAMESYRFRVRAENVHGLSEPGMESDVITISDAATTDEMSENVFGIQTNNGNESEDEFEPPFEARIVSTEPGHLFEERYDVLEELGKGRYGIVRRIVDRNNELNLAAKFVRTIKFKDRQQVHDEINIMNILRHPKLLRLAAAFENPKEMIMVTEYISGGELFERVVADDFTLTEKDSILFVRQICQGVEYMHNNNVVHLDLKPENIMCHTRTSHRIKLIDFGLAQTLRPDTPVRVLFGTPEFIPPEIIGFEPIGTESDMWSVGVICYVLLSGLSPFMGDNDAETFANITRAEYDFDDKAFHAISEEAQDFISSLLVKRKEFRMSATDCLKHPWLAQRDESMSRVALPTDKLKKFIVRRKWQKTGNAIRALGRMATLSANTRRNISASPPLSKSFDEDIEIDSLDLRKEPIVEHAESLVHPTPENSPDASEAISYINECDNNGVEIEEIDDDIEGLQTSPDLSLGELAENNTNELDNADSSTIVEVQRSYSFDEYTKVENNENNSLLDDSNSTSELMNDVSSTAEIPNTSDEISSETETMFTAIDSSIKENIVTVDISPTSLDAIINDHEDDTASFCSFKNLHVNEPVNESTKYEIEAHKIVEDEEEQTTTMCTRSTMEVKQEELFIAPEDRVPPTRPSFIAIKSFTNPIDYTPSSKTNPSSLGTESENTRLKKNSPLHRIVRTGSVSRTAKMFEQEDLSSPIRQPASPGGRIVIPAPEARPQNERIRKAFAFWNK